MLHLINTYIVMTCGMYLVLYYYAGLNLIGHAIARLADHGTETIQQTVKIRILLRILYQCDHGSQFKKNNF